LLHHCIEPLWKEEFNSKALSRNDSNSRFQIRPPFPYLSISNLLIIKGGVCRALLECFHTDAIFSLQGFRSILARPEKVFSVEENRPGSSDSARHDSLVRAFKSEDSQEIIFNMFKSWAEAVKFESPSAIPNIQIIGDTLHHHALQLEHGRTINKRELLETTVEEEDRSPKATAAWDQVCVPKDWAIDISNREMNWRYIVDGAGSSLSLAPLAIMLRETLRHKHGGSIPSDDGDILALSWLQEASNLTTGKPTQQYFEDQVNVIREDHQSVKLLRQVLPLHVLKTGIGLANLVIWFSTGQSVKTKDFIMMPPSVLRNMSEVEGKLHSSKVIWSDKNLWQIKTQNIRVWGQPNIHLSWYGLKQSPQKRFSFLFEPKLQDSWVSWIEKDVHSWYDTYKWISEHVKINGFAGLTLFQCVNNLAYVGICKKPSLAELAVWTSNNSSLGAAHGLSYLGFSCSRGPAMVWRLYGALTVLNSFLCHYLSKEDQADLHYDTIWIEHMLCKLSRWANIWKKGAGGDNFYDTAEKMCISATPYSMTFKSSADSAHNTYRLPIPAKMQMEDKCVTLALQSCNEDQLTAFIGEFGFHSLILIIVLNLVSMTWNAAKQKKSNKSKKARQKY
jgi:hypothetical protein